MRSFLALLAVLALPAGATTWSCGLGPGATRIVCHAEDTADTAVAETAAPVVVHGTRFPLDVQRTWVVDLWTPATDMPGVRQLAQVTICYRSPGCTVVWREGGPATVLRTGP